MVAETAECQSRLSVLADRYLAERGWEADHSVEAQPPKTMAVAFVDHCDQTYRIFIETYPDREWIVVFIYTPYCVMASSVREAKMLVSHINCGVGNGWIAIRDAGCPFQFKQVLDAEGAELTTRVIDNMVRTGLALLERWRPALAAVALIGASADDAVLKVDPHHEGGDPPDLTCLPSTRH